MDEPAEPFPSVRSGRLIGLWIPDDGPCLPYRYEVLVDADGCWEVAETVGAATSRAAGCGAAPARVGAVVSALRPRGPFA